VKRTTEHGQEVEVLNFDRNSGKFDGYLAIFWHICRIFCDIVAYLTDI